MIRRILTALSCTALAMAGEPDPVVSVVAAETAFACDLYKSLAAAPEASGNRFFSPYSISRAMALCRAGAAQETAAQIDRVFRWSLPVEALAQAMADRDRRLMEQTSVALSVGNRLWVQEGFRLRQGFLDLLRTRDDALAETVDFRDHTEAARRSINAWVAKKTRDRIPELIREGVLTADTRTVLTNAIHFRGRWLDPFRPVATREDDFHLADGSTSPCRLMRRRGTYGHAKVEGASVVRLFYGQSDDGRGVPASLLVVVPDSVDGLAAIESGLNAERLAAWDAALSPVEVELALPRWEVRSPVLLKGVLTAMGVTDAFTPGVDLGGKADFSGMTGRRDLNLGQVVHEAWVKVDEEGTEAAAATAAVMTLGAAPDLTPPVVVRADRPFLYLIRDGATGTVLFMGRLVKPEDREAKAAALPEVRPVDKETAPPPPPSLPVLPRPGAVKPPVSALPPAAVSEGPIDPTRAGAWRSGVWTYTVRITAAGTRSEGIWSDLQRDGQTIGALADPKLPMKTPWGDLRWHESPMAWGRHGWFPAPAVSGKEGAVPKPPPSKAD